MTVVAIHQPDFLPYLGFFQKMALADILVLYDTAQYSKNGYHNRNRIKSPQGPRWITVPVRSSGSRALGFIEIDNAQAWAKRAWRTLEANYARAEHFEDLAGELRNVLQGTHWVKLTDFNARLLEVVRDFLGLRTTFILASTLDKCPETDPTERLIGMTRMVGGDIYLSGAGGRSYLNPLKFRDIELRFTEFRTQVYRQLWGPFVPDLSVVDALFNCGIQTRQLLLRPELTGIEVSTLQHGSTRGIDRDPS